MGPVELWRTRVRGTDRARDASDAVLTGVAGLLLIAVGAQLWPPPTGTAAPGWAHVPLLVLGCLVMLVKRRHPVGALAAGVALLATDAVLGGSIAVLLVAIDLLYSAALHAGARGVDALRGLAAAVIGGGTTAALAVSGELRTTVLIGLNLVALVGTPLWWGLAVRRQSELTALAREHAADLARLAALREADAVARERARMARDLHDAIAGNLSAVAIHAEAALAVPAGSPGAAARDRAALEAVRPAAVTSLQEMRSMIGLLRGEDDPVPAPARLHEADRLLSAARGAGLAVDVDGVPFADLPVLPAAVDQAAYRILQESLTNAAKHAVGARVQVTVDVAPDTLRLDVRSGPGPRTVGRPGGDGPAHHGGAATDPAGGLGLLTMRERAEGVGGRLRAGPDGTGAWSVVATLPAAGLVPGSAASPSGSAASPSGSAAGASA